MSGTPGDSKKNPAVTKSILGLSHSELNAGVAEVPQVPSIANSGCDHKEICDILFSFLTYIFRFEILFFLFFFQFKTGLFLIISSSHRIQI